MILLLKFDVISVNSAMTSRVPDSHVAWRVVPLYPRWDV